MIPDLLGTTTIDVEAPYDADLVRDLELDRLLDAMADGDDRVRAVARALLLTPVHDRAALARRQDAMEDCHRHADAVVALHGIAARGVAQAHDRSDPLWMLSLHPTPTQRLTHAGDRLERLLPLLGELRGWCATTGRTLGSDAFRALCDRIEEVLDDVLLTRLGTLRRELAQPDGIVASASLNGVGEVDAVRLRRARPENRHLLGGTPVQRPSRTYRIPERDQAGFDAFAELSDRSVLRASSTASAGIAGIDAFLLALQDETGFLLAGHRLRTRLEEIGVEVSRPRTAHPVGLDVPSRSQTGFCAEALVDPCLALSSGAAPVSNDVEVGADEVLVVTGANHGGKSTLLRAIGLAQLMLQSGLPVAARACTAALVGRVHSHWPRAEDETLRHGKFDDELDRMRTILDETAPGDLLLSNESFASTNEREGSLIGVDIVTALARSGVRVALVTHLFDLADALSNDSSTPATFLRAPRDADGSRPFRLEPGPPLPTSYAADLFDRAFGTELAGPHDRVP